MAGEKFELYHYNPSLPAAIAAAVLFLGSTSVHAFQMSKNRTWYWIPFVIGGTFEILGYTFRSISSQDKTAVPPYVGQSLLLLLAPALFAASIYMVLGRIIAMLPNGEKHSLIRRNWMTKIFVIGDVISFMMQGGGGGILGSAKGDKDKQKLGEHMIVYGLIVQLVFFGFFMVVSLLFWRRYHKGEVVDKTVVANAPEGRWRMLMKVLLFTSMLILVRSIFRVVEYLGGYDGYLLKREMYLYAFDALLMFQVMVLFNWCFPGTVVRKEKSADVEEYSMGGGRSPLRG